MDDLPLIVDWICRNRSQHQNAVLLDLLDLHQMWTEGRIGPKKRLRVDVLEARWGVTRVGVSLRLCKLKAAGLVDYSRGWHEDPGYLFHRIGPDFRRRQPHAIARTTTARPRRTP